jgi:acetyl-CoA synthetase
VDALIGVGGEEEPPPALRATSPNVASILGEETVGGASLLGEETVIPVLHLWMAGDQASRGLDRLREAGAPVTEEPRAAIRAIAGLTRLTAEESAPTLEPITGPLEEWGPPLVEGELAVTGDEAVAVAERFGFPVVVKVVSPGLAHKTEMGGVAVDLGDGAAVAEAFDRVTGAARTAGLGVDGARVERFRPGLELIVGGIVDPVFGPMVSVGIGGVLAELLDDVSFAPAPVDESGATGMIDRLRGRRLLDGYRGSPAADVDELARIVSRVSRGLAGGTVDEVEFNPLVWTGEEWVAVDWLVSPSTG